MSKIISAYTDDALGMMDATAVAEAIAKKEISAKEAVEAAIERAEKVNPALNAIVLKTYDDALNIAKPSNRGALYGVPSFIKDNDNIAGYPTQLGTGVFKAKPMKKNSKFVDQFMSTGVRNLGKTTLPEFGLICTTENERWGITRNPWNTDYTTGGSSSGSAAMVASGVVPIATANDGGGSIRIPASICGLVGLKPTRDRVHSIDGSETLPIQIAHQGVLTRSVRDTALFYSEAEKHYHNPNLPKIGHVEHAGKKRLRIAFLENIPEGSIGYQDADTYNLQLQTAKLLADLGHEVEQIPIPINADEMIDNFLDYYGFIAYMTSHLSRITLKAKVDRKLLEPFTMGLSKRFKSRFYKLPWSLRALRKIAAGSEAKLGQYDVVMSPVLSHKTPKIGYLSPELSYEEILDRTINFATYCGLQNISGDPSMSLPLGTDSDGMPMGVLFTAPYGMDQRLLELAYELEAAKPWGLLKKEA